MIDNPPWIDRLLTEHWTDIAAALEEPAWMPITVEMGRARRRAVPPEAEYGCGSYGCVMATSQPNVVCKITTDKTEARFIELAWERFGAHWPEGIVRYLKLAKLEGSRHKNRDAWILWRTEAWDVGGLNRALSHTVMGHRTLPEYERDALMKGSHRLFTFKQAASAIRLKVKDRIGTKPLAEAINAWKNHVHYDLVWEFVEPNSVSGRVRAEQALARLRWPDWLAAHLLLCEQVAQLGSQEPGLTEVMETLLAFMNEGMLLADVHTANIGRPEPTWRNDQRGTWIITDPGHLVALW